MWPRSSRALRITQVASAVLFCLTTAGVIFGYAALKPVLVSKGVYRELCQGEGNDSTGQTCIEQDLRLNFMFTIGTVVTNIFTLPIGILLDHAGPRTTSLLGAFVFATGNFLFGLEITTQYIDTYFLGFILLAIGGLLIYLSSFHLSNAFPRHSGLVLSFITGAFNCSSFSYLIFWWLDTVNEISIRTFFWSYISIPVLLAVQQLLTGSKESYRQGEFDDEISPERLVGVESEVAHGSATFEEFSASTGGSLGENSGSKSASGDGARSEPFAGAMAGKSVQEQILSNYFWLIVLFLCVYMSRINYYIQTVSQQLIFYLKDQNLAESVSTAFTILLPTGGVVGIPIIGYILDKKGSGTTAVVILIAGVVYGVLGIISYLPAQLISIGIFVVFRPLMFTFIGDYIGKAFGYKTFGTVYGLLNCLAGVFGLVLRPIDVFTQTTLHGNYTIVNIIGVVLGLIFSAAVVWRIYHTPTGRITL